MKLIVLLPVVAAGCLLFGLGTLVQIGISVGCAVLATIAAGKVLRRPTRIKDGRTVVHAVLLALMIPPGCGATVAAVGALLLVLVEQLFGATERYLWHPVLVARVLLCFVFPAAMSPPQWTVLKKDHVALGDLRRSEPLPANISWFEARGSETHHAWAGPRPIDALCEVYRSSDGGGRSPDDALLELLRDRLPPVGDCLFGATGGAPGETCVLAILLGGLFFVYRQAARWTLAAGAVLGLVIAASVLPIPDGSPGAAAWLPVRLYAPGHPTSLPVGLIFVWYHLMVGEFLFATFFLASAFECSPRTARGQFHFGLAIGLLTVALRFIGFASGSTYWAVLVMNTFVPLNDRFTSRAPAGPTATLA